MSVSTYITFLKDKEYHERMLGAVRALVKVNVEDLPSELAEYFGTSHAEEALTDTDDLLEETYFSLEADSLPPFAKRDDDFGIEIDLAKLQASVKHIRIWRS